MCSSQVITRYNKDRYVCSENEVIVTSKKIPKRVSGIGFEVKEEVSTEIDTAFESAST